jgi:hypothetical protein
MDANNLCFGYVTEPTNGKLQMLERKWTIQR